MWQNLFYDKYIGPISNSNGRHDFNNPITSKINIEDFQDGSYYYYYNKPALEFYNNKFPESFAIPEDILDNNFEQEFIKIHIYTKKIHDPGYNKFEPDLETMYTIIGLNTKLLEKYFIQKNIPHEQFIKRLCSYHRSYLRENKWDMFCTKSQSDIKSQMETNINFIIKSAMEPANYSLEDKIANPPEINLTLFEYQKSSINWLIEREKNKKKITYNLSEEIILGNIYYDLSYQSFKFMADRKSIWFSGGGLIDEVGLGKTIQIIALAIKNPSNILSYTLPELKNKFYSRATLIFCPNQLCGQWLRELKDKITKSYEPKIIQILTKRDFDKITYSDLLDADYILVSYTFMDNKNFTSRWVPYISKIKSFHKLNWAYLEKQTVSKIFSDLGAELLQDPINSLCKTNPLLFLIHYHRVVVDEFHEIYSTSLYKYMANILPFFTGDYKWVVTATPFAKPEILYHIINFTSSYTNLDSEHILAVESVVDYSATNLFRRNTKASVATEYTIPAITEEIRWLKFSPTERMIYNAYLADPNNDKFSVYLRQLCCHPQLAEETKAALSNCKTLADIETMMVTHYKSQVESAQEKFDKINIRVNKLKKKIKKLEKKLTKKALKSGKLESDSESGSDSDSDELLDLDELNIINLKSATLDNLKQALDSTQQKLAEAQNILDGKTATANFFTNVVEKIRKTTNKIKPDNLEDSDDDDVCGVCLSQIAEENLGVTQCGHIFCYDCITLTINKFHNCPYCKKTLNINNYYRLSFEKEKPKELPTNKTQLINLVGTKLANLILYLRESDHTIIFSQWDDLLHRVGRILQENNIPTVFCRGNIYQRDKAIRDFNSDNKIKIIMLSSDSAAAGTNLTKAKQVIFIDPIYGNYKFRKDQERQAIGRAHRLGQKSKIKIIRFIIHDSVEEDIHKINKTEDKLYDPIFESSTDLEI